MSGKALRLVVVRRSVGGWELGNSHVETFFDAAAGLVGVVGVVEGVHC